MADRPPARPWRGQECLVPGCERPNRALGLCKVHAQRAYSANEQPWLSPEIEAQVRARRAAHTYGPPDVQDAEPVRALRAQLIELRAAGVPCDVAWTIAVEIVAPDLDPWSDALAWARDDWRAA
jgi:hypothetical protein